MMIGSNCFKCKQSKHFNQSRDVKVHYRGMEKWLGGQEHLLLLDRIHI